MNDDFEIFQQKLSEFSKKKEDPFLHTQYAHAKKVTQNSNPTILIIDDDPDIRESLKIILQKKYNVILCSSGSEGIRQTNETIFAVILDIKMEGKNGFETFKEIKNINLYLPIIFYSAYQDIKNPLEILNEYKPFGYIVKGSEGKTLLDTIESAVDYYLKLNEKTILLKTVNEQEEQYRTLINNLNVGVYRNTGGPNGKFLQANPAIVKIFGYDSKEEFMQKSVSDLYMYPEDRKIFIEMIEKNGFCKNHELRLRKKDGSLIWASLSVTSSKDSSGNILWLDGVLDDITEMKQSVYKLEGLMKDISFLNSNLEQKVSDRTSELKKTLSIIRDDLSVAQKIQQNTLYTNFSLIEELKIIPIYLPMSEVGGDFYGISKFNDHTYRIFIADATGHGVQAALITMAIKGIYDSIKQVELPVNTILEIFNEEFIERYISLQSLLTAMILEIDVENHKIRYASAGHPAGVILDNSKIHLLKKTGRMIGVVREGTYKSSEFDFKPGNRLFLLTDGLFEEFNSKEEEFGEEKLHSLLVANSHKSLNETIEIVLNELSTFLNTVEKQDDITLLGIEYK